MRSSMLWRMTVCSVMLVVLAAVPAVSSQAQTASPQDTPPRAARAAGAVQDPAGDGGGVLYVRYRAFVIGPFVLTFGTGDIRGSWGDFHGTTQASWHCVIPVMMLEGVWGEPGHPTSIAVACTVLHKEQGGPYYPRPPVYSLVDVTADLTVGEDGDPGTLRLYRMISGQPYLSLEGSATIKPVTIG